MRGATGVAIDRIQQRYSLSSADDSIYYSILCENCGIFVGRLYLKTSEDLECLLGGFSFDVNAINSHQLGQCEVRAAGRPIEGGTLPGSNGIESATTRCSLPHLPDGAAPSSKQNLLDRMEQLEADLIKMQNILLLHNERLEAIESIPTSTVPSTDAAPQQHSSGIGPPGHPANHCEPADLTATAHEPAAASVNEQAAANQTAVESRGHGPAGPACSTIQLGDLQQAERAQMETGQDARMQPEQETDIAPTGKRGGSRSQKRARRQEL
ncbi:g9038 [Coccomyxa elongata]